MYQVLLNYIIRGLADFENGVINNPDPDRTKLYSTAVDTTVLERLYYSKPRYNLTIRISSFQRSMIICHNFVWHV